MKKGKSKQSFAKRMHLATANRLYQQHKRRRYTWTSPDGQYRNQIDLQTKMEKHYTVSKSKTRSGLWLRP